MDVRLPDGTIVRGVPDGMSKADLTAKLASNGYDTTKLQSAPTNPPNATEGNSFVDNALIGVGKAFTDLGQGAGQALRGAIEYVAPPQGGSSIADKIGLPNQADVDEKRRMDAEIMSTGGGKVGNFVGAAIPAIGAAFIPGAQGLAGGTGPRGGQLPRSAASGDRA